MMLYFKKILFLAILFLSIGAIAQTDTTYLLRKIPKLTENKHAQVYCQLAEISMSQNIDQALFYANYAYELSVKHDNHKCLVHSLDLLANLNLMNNSTRKALKFYEEELQILEKKKDTMGMALVYYNLGKANYLDSKERKSEKYFQSSLELALKIDAIDLCSKNYEILFALNYNKNKYKEALIYFKDYIKIKDSSLLTQHKREYEVLMRNFSYAIDTTEKYIEQKENTIKKKDSAISIVTMQRDTLKVVTDAQGEEIKQLNYEKAYQDELIQKQKLQRNFLILISLMVLFLFFVAYSRYQYKKRANAKLQEKNSMIMQQKEEIEAQRDNLKELNNELEQQKEEIIAQRDELQDKKKIIEKKNEDITSSIRYAKRIQSAALPSIKLFDGLFSDYFIFFKPRDIVSGDFYWMKKVEDKIFVTVADCTGHGVPGAFVSMLGISMLNEVTSRNPHWNAAQVLNQLRELIKESLNQDAVDSESKDGMDMALCIIDQKAQTIEFAGANNPLFIVRQDELIIYKATRNPVAVHIKEKEFENHELRYQKNDMLYLFSDGFPDQFGGNDAGKFKISRFKTLVTEMSNESCSFQNDKLSKVLENWMLDEDQIDDITVLGIRL